MISYTMTQISIKIHLASGFSNFHRNRNDSKRNVCVCVCGGGGGPWSSPWAPTGEKYFSHLNVRLIESESIIAQT